ncbi:hypothetical protein M5X06_24220 [Paenibacillus alvei]|uniref:Germination protein, Ger(X)C family n=2 Tax=Paenibacillus TaxID=44249 RepID=A0ABT4GYQ4_PAEAL|nr:hypothetical protein [Paenibacillus alvei]MCY7482840.1 hypothetical protein [Paenibacillus alvei]MCY9761850.1 hypothetical protein [Paenibacillus alvei]MCY9769892.1 hypothetical protein [Paenibacillus alvei]
MSLFYHEGERSLYRSRKQRLWLLVSILSLVLPLAGCWDIKNVQDMNYVTALGIDYVNGKYIVYTNSLEFTNVAK